MTAALSLRAAAPDDEPFLMRLLGQVRATEFALLPGELAGRLLAQQREAQRRSMSARPGGYEEIAIDPSGATVGRLATARDGDALQLVDVTIDAAHRGQGYGTELVRLTIERAAAQRLPVVLRVAHTNPAARRLYEREGFVEIDRDQIDAVLRREAPATS